ncbi:hypothetical protein Golax_009171 [Gossypium laxum]|uniref:RNase H type-1 domain-containing protein n=1 Tax=Gossypium laxum TaxID=34288 RepID=A0A7J9AC69_9ROSI|nr:hypothetical protein [Gossypium laxum]
METFKNGFGWQDGNGDCINIRVDNWGIEDLNGGTFNSNMLNPHEKSVRDLWIENDWRWDIDKVYKLYGKDWGDRSWVLVRIGSFEKPFGNSTSCQRFECSLGGCPRCGVIVETLIHAFKDCPTSYEILSIGGWDTSTMSRVSVHEAKCLAFERSIELACQLNINGMVLFETDHAGLMNKMRNLGTDVTTVGARIKECKQAFSNFKSTALIGHVNCSRFFMF